MRRLVFSLFTLLLLSAPSLGQTVGNDQRTNNTKIANLLAKLPSQTGIQHENNMREVEALGEKGIEQLALMLKDPKEVDNSAVEYALSGYSFYVTAPNRESARKMAARAYYRALARIKSVEQKVFLINQLELVGKDDVTGYLLNYINDPELSDAVVKALIKINTQSARRALLNSLYGSTGEQQIRLVQAMGVIQCMEASSTLNAWLPAATGRLKKVLQYALSEIADPSSLPMLARQAEKQSFQFDTTNATGYFVSYLQHLLERGHRQEVDNAAYNVWKKATEPGAQKTRFAMLHLLVASRGSKVVPLLREAVKDKNRSNRVYALNLALNFNNDREISAWVNQLKAADPASKRDIIEMLGRSGNQLALVTVTDHISSTQREVQIAAIKATAKLGGQSAQQVLMDKLVKSDGELVQIIKQELLELKGSGLNTAMIGESLSELPEQSIPLAIELLGCKAAVDQMDKVKPYLQHSNPAIQKAAYTALPSLATQKTLPELYRLLNEANNKEQLQLLQSAIINAIATIADTAQMIKTLQEALVKAPLPKQPLFYELFATIGTKNALYAVTKAFENGNEATKIAIIHALAKWSNETAVEPLYQAMKKMVNNAEYPQLFTAYLSLLSRSNFTYEQRLLELRRAMEIAQTQKQQQQILLETGKCKTLLALLFAGNYLQDPGLKEQAAIAVMQIAMADENQWTGVLVEDIIQRAIPLIKGSDASYQQHALKEKLAKKDKEAGFVSLFNGKNLSGWKGLVENPLKRASMTAAQLKAAQIKADSIMKAGWEAKDGILIFKGKGSNLCTEKQYRNFELYVDWQITPKGDAGIYLRGTPQVQIWDTSRVEVGAQVGSGGLYNNRVHPSIPLVMADNAINAWNSFYIKMIGEKVTVYLNGKLVVDNVVLENYWDKNLPIIPIEQIELQAHGTYVAYRDLYIRELPSVEK